MSRLLVIASVCFSDVQRITVPKPSTISRSATAYVGPGEIRIILGSDNLVGEYDPRLMHKLRELSKPAGLMRELAHVSC